MPYHPEVGLIERLATKWGFLPDTRQQAAEGDYRTRREDGTLVNFPPVEKWDDWVEYDPKAWPKKCVPRHYSLVPTICFNCEAACGLLAYIDKETQTVRRF